MKKSLSSNQPSANEIRLRAELDRVRRELTKLKKSLGVAEGERPSGAMARPKLPPTPAKAPPPVPVADPPADAPPDLETHEKRGATTDLELSQEPAARTAATPAATSGAKPEPLAQQVQELTQAKQRLSRLYFTQLEENRKRAATLHQVLANIGRINAEPDLDALM